MAQHDFPAIGKQLEDIQNGSKGIQNQGSPGSDRSSLVGYNELQQEMIELRQELRQRTDGILPTIAILQEIRGQIEQLQNEYLH